MKNKIKKVIVEYRFENCFRTEENEIGVLFENGKVLVADVLGGVAVYNSQPSQNEGCVVVDLDNDSADLTVDSPESVVSMILGVA